MFYVLCFLYFIIFMLTSANLPSLQRQNVALWTPRYWKFNEFLQWWIRLGTLFTLFSDSEDTSLDFQRRILENSGTGESTHWPPGGLAGYLERKLALVTSCYMAGILGSRDGETEAWQGIAAWLVAGSKVFLRGHLWYGRSSRRSQGGSDLQMWPRRSRPPFVGKHPICLYHLVLS